MHRNLFEADHEAYRDTVREFLAREVELHYERWETERLIDRSAWLAAGKSGIVGLGVPEEYGGSGVTDYRFRCVVAEEIARTGTTSFGSGMSLQDDIAIPYVADLGTEDQKRRWLPGMAAGELIGAIAMTEPGAGSDLAAVATTAIPDGDHFVLNGSKIFISNGLLADTIIVVAKTDPAAGKNGVSLLVVEDGMPGFTKNGPLDKVGLSAQDTAELVFDDVRVPRANLLGEENRGFGYLRHNLPQERLSIAVTSMALMTRTFETALRYATDRTAFGQRIADFQANRFYLAELATEIEIAQVFVDRCILDAAHGRLDEVTAAMAKWWVTELHLKVVHRAVQLHGGYGFMKEYDVARDYLDSRAGTLYGGTTEIMKEIVGRRLTRT